MILLLLHRNFFQDPRWIDQIGYSISITPLLVECVPYKQNFELSKGTSVHDISFVSIDMAATEGNEHDFISSENDIMNKELKGGEVKNMISATKLLLMEPRRAILLTVYLF